MLIIYSSSSSPVVVAEMQWDCRPQTQQATAGRLTGWPCPSCRAFRWILSGRKSQIQKQMHTQTTKRLAMNHPRKPLGFAWLLGIHFQRDDIQSSTLNQKHGWFKKEERWSLWKVIFILSETSFSSRITAESANSNFEFTLFLEAIVTPGLSCFVGK